MKPMRNHFPHEKMPVTVFPVAQAAIPVIAGEIAELIRTRQAENRMAVLGLATGSSPVPLYRELIRMHREDGLSFKNVVTFNLDEYYPISNDHPESYHCFMKEQLFNHIDIPEDQIHIPSGESPRDGVVEMCEAYEQAIQDAGGLDIQLLGIGRTGHIGFNEPGSSLKSVTRLVTLDSMTRSDAARDFLGENNVPRHAITMGVGTIMAARKIFMLAWGRSKASIVRKAVEEDPHDAVPASFLQEHPSVRVVLDQAAASELTRCKRPWLVDFVEWTPSLVRRAVTGLSLESGKPLLKLVDKDYQENGLADLISEYGSAYDLNIRIFNEVQHTITGWPGGKPYTDDSHRPERADPASKRVVVLSPEPLDDMLAMAGTLHRLVDQGHEVTVAYLTSGSLGVPDEEASWVAATILEAGYTDPKGLASVAHEELSRKQSQEQDTPSIRRLKAMVRRSEARAALKICGVASERALFLDLPFYEKGKYRQFAVESEDVERILNLLMRVKPHQVFFTGASADPSSVPAKGFEAMLMALGELKEEEWLEHCYFWQFVSGNREWEIDQIEMAVPSSPDELAKKIQAIYQHRSQMSQVPLADSAHSEIWEQTRQRNCETAVRVDRLGLAEYEAIECFVRWHPSCW